MSELQNHLDQEPIVDKKLLAQVDSDLRLIEVSGVKLPKTMTLHTEDTLCPTTLTIEDVGIVFSSQIYPSPKVVTFRHGKWVDVIHALAEEKRQRMEEEKRLRFTPVDDTHIDYTVD